MSTRCNIGYKNPETGKFHVVYSHYDGYEDGVGRSLIQAYNSFEAIKELVDAGDMRYPGEPYSKYLADPTIGPDDEDEITTEIVDTLNECFQQEHAYVWVDDKLMHTKYGLHTWLPFTEDSW